MKVSIITGVLNKIDTIEDCLRSIYSQSYSDIEHIIIDGGSTDGTLDIIRDYKDKIAKVVSEPDNGIYSALNKGISLATGDIIGILHSDDFYAHHRVIEKVVDTFKTNEPDSCYGDLQYVSKENKDKIIRYWKAAPYSQEKFRYGWMPPHPTFFVKRWVYERYGYFSADFKISADYELMLRFLFRHKISTYYIPEVLVKMRLGGTSNKNLRNLWLKINEDFRAGKLNNLRGSLTVILFKNLIKIPQFAKRV